MPFGRIAARSWRYYVTNYEDIVWRSSIAGASLGIIITVGVKSPPEQVVVAGAMGGVVFGMFAATAPMVIPSVVVGLGLRRFIIPPSPKL